ncbi:MAG: amidohydrolase family protein, partial [Methylotenera sp.]|nr:amidohydrolase family protein [Methylotenera sp.]
VLEAPSNVAATITAHHLLMNRNDMFKGGIQPHHYCLPILKREEHRVALVKAATSGNPKFFLGTDSAPHAKHTKEAACGCAGMYTARTAMELYAEVFEAANALDKLEGFASFYGADFYGLPRNTERVTLVKESWKVPGSLPYDGDVLVPLRAGQAVQWKLLTQ